MRLRIGALGLALVSVLVVGSVAQQPAYYTVPDPQVLDDPASGLKSTESTSPENLEFAAAENQGLEFQNSGVPPHQAARMTGSLPLAPEASESGPQMGAAGQLIGFSGFDGSGSQTITLVHAGKMQIAVYHIDRSGQIRLVSSRPIDADFSLSLNVTAPLPGQIRLLGGQVK